MPKRFIAAAANGPARPNRIRLTETAAEMTVRLQPNSSCSGTMSTPGVDRNPEAPSSVRKVTAATTQAGCGPRRRCVTATVACTSALTAESVW